jgi:hypothetical protein
MEMYFIFRFSSPQTVLIKEGNEVHLTVVRLQGSFREVRVSWNISADAFPDISPANGTLTFYDVSIGNISRKMGGLANCK